MKHGYTWTFNLACRGGIALASAWLLLASGLYASTPESASNDSELQARYQDALASGNQTEALRHVLEYAERTRGENAPETAKLTHRYGHALYRDFRFREATEILKTALAREVAAHGATGGETFEICMNIGYAYSRWSPRFSNRLKYFDRALEILQARGDHESLVYVETLVSIVVNLLGNDGMSGSYRSTISDTLNSPDVAEYILPVESEYENHFHVAKPYISEAVELAEKLRDRDPYLAAKVAIVQAQLNVRETADLAAVPMGVRGYISRGTARDYYGEEKDRLAFAAKKLAENPELNRVYLQAANKALLEVAWLDRDRQAVLDMCTGGGLNSADEYPPDRLYEVSEDGMVFAPELGPGVSMNLFRPRISSKAQKKDKNGNPIKKPYFVPVCIDGNLMAALINAPRVTVEEL